MQHFIIPKRAKTAIEHLNNAGYEAYIVGGSLRDAILGKEAHDIDITTNALPSQIAEVFKPEYSVIEIGARFGTVGVLIEGMLVEITTYRSEDVYEDGRHPEKIHFETELSKDLSRRDFTINAMAYHEKMGLIDLYGGEKDLNNKIVRCVGEPYQRFQEDKLRMLRAIRFASTLGFTLEEKTFQAIKDLAQGIHSISIERINQELSKMLLTSKPSRAIILLQQSGLLREILPVIDEMVGFDQQNPYHEKDLFFHTLEVLDNVEADLILRLAALFHDSGKLTTKTVDENGVGHFYGHDKASAQIAGEYLKKLKYSNATIDMVVLLVLRHMIAPSTITAKGIRKLISQFGLENIDLLVKLQKADSKATTIGENTILEDKIHEVLNQKSVFSRKDLKVNGFDMMDLGFQGKQIKELTEYLMEIVLEDPEQNEREHLISLIHDYKSKQQD